MTEHLQAIVIDEIIAVRDNEDGASVWYPNDEAQEEIKNSADPKAAAVQMCDLQPMRGKWSN